jgi:DNA ligase-1
MKTFARLVNALDSTNKTTQKLNAIDRFLDEATETDKLWLLALFTGKRPRRPVNSILMRQWAMEITGLPEWLFMESYSSVGDLSETIALILPPPTDRIERTLTEWMTLITELKNKTETEKKAFVLHAWQGLPLIERFIFNKLIGGGFRLGISSKSLIQALANHYNLDASAISHSIMGNWQTESVSFEGLIRGHYANTQLSKPYPFCLAYPLEKSPSDLGNIRDWQAEYKWDGIRGQFIKRKGEIFIWSRGEELITTQFPPDSVPGPVTGIVQGTSPATRVTRGDGDIQG